LLIGIVQGYKQQVINKESSR